jgi:hypothetical protein
LSSPWPERVAIDLPGAIPVPALKTGPRQLHARITNGGADMGWEARAGGTYYYYRSVRVGGRIKRLYLGRGAIAAEAEWLDADARKRRNDEREALRADLQSVEPLEKVMQDLDQVCRRMFEAVLLGAGYHQSVRTWRFRRESART